MIKNRLFEGVFAAYFVLAVGLACLHAHAANVDDLFQVSSQDVAADLDGYFKQVQDDLAGNKISQARQALALIGVKINQHKSVISRDQKKSYVARMAALNGTVKQKVDSLVKVNLAILAKQGSTQAIEFRQQLAVQKGISELELAPVDEAIMQSGPTAEEYKPVRSAAEEPAPPEPLAPPSAYETPVAPPKESTEPPGEPPQAQPNAAVSKPQEEETRNKPEEKPAAKPEPTPAMPARTEPARASEIPGSVPAEVPRPEPAHAGPALKSELAPPQPEPVATSAPPAVDDAAGEHRTTAISAAARVRALLDEGKIEEARTAFQIYEKNMQRYLDPAKFESLKSDVGAVFAQHQAKATWTANEVQTIEDQLGQDRAAEAYTEFQKSQDELKHNCDRATFRDLQERVGQAYGELTRKRAAAEVTVGEIRSSLAGGKPEEAYLAFEKSSADLQRYVAPAVYENVRQNVAAAYGTMRDKKKQSELCSRDIAALVAGGQGAAAFARFNDNRELLSHYLDAQAFKTLEGDVTRANNEYTAQRDRARAIASNIESLLSAKKAQEARQAFEKARAELEQHLGDEKRVSLLNAQTAEAYAHLRENTRWATRYAKSLDDLIDRKEGLKAYAAYQQSAQQLGAYLDPREFKRLEAGVLRAKSDFETNQVQCRAEASRVQALLSQGKIEDASASLAKAQDAMDHYLAGDKNVEDLGSRVHAAYVNLQERKRWASAAVREIRSLVEHGEGAQAFARFSEAKADLAKYCDAHVVSSLEAAVVQANKLYGDQKAQAEQAAALVRGLLSQKRVEDAYAAFDTSESRLRKYLAPQAVDDLQTSVDKANGALQDKKREALRIVGKIDRLIEQNDGELASSMLQQNAAFLTKYLAAPNYSALDARVARAKADFEKNQKQAQQIGNQLVATVSRGRVEEAYAQLRDKRDYLKQYLGVPKFAILDSAVSRPYQEFSDKRKEARFTAGNLARLIRQNQATAAKEGFDRSREGLRQYLPREEYSAIKQKVDQAYANSQQGRREARESADAISGLLDRGMAREAYETLDASRQTLRLYLDEAEYRQLEAKTQAAYDDMQEKRRRVDAYARELRSLVRKNKLWDAYLGLRMHRADLKTYMDADAYADLEQTVEGAYAKAREK